MSYVIQWDQVRTVRDDEVVEEDTYFFRFFKGPLVSQWDIQLWKAAIFKRQEGAQQIIRILFPKGDDEWNTYSVRRVEAPPTVRVLVNNGKVILKRRSVRT